MEIDPYYALCILLEVGAELKSVHLRSAYLILLINPG